MQRLMLAISQLRTHETPIRMVSRRNACVVNGQTSPERPRSECGRIRYDRIHCAVDKYTERSSGSTAEAVALSENCFIESSTVLGRCRSEIPPIISLLPFGSAQARSP